MFFTVLTILTIRKRKNKRHFLSFLAIFTFVDHIQSVIFFVDHNFHLIRGGKVITLFPKKWEQTSKNVIFLHKFTTEQQNGKK